MLGYWTSVTATFVGQIRQPGLGNHHAELVMVHAKHKIVSWFFVITVMQCMAFPVSPRAIDSSSLDIISLFNPALELATRPKTQAQESPQRRMALSIMCTEGEEESIG